MNEFIVKPPSDTPFVIYNIYNGTPSGDFLRPHTNRVSGTGYRSHLDKLVYLNLAPGSTWQPSFRKENHQGQRAFVIFRTVNLLSIVQIILFVLLI
jgi:hypothetical protein